jgi:hypothetical protein
VDGFQLWLDSVRGWLPFVAFAISIYALVAKWQEKPRLSIRLADPVFSEGLEGVRWRFVHIAVCNPQLSRVFRWLTYRQPARNTRVELAYYVPNGTRPKFQFDARWSGNPEPIQERIIDGERQSFFDPWLVHLGRYRDLASGDKPQDIAIALKVEGDPDCYGFTNEAYQSGNMLRVPEHKLPPGRYVVQAVAVSGEIQSQPTRFLLHNDGPALTDLWLDVPAAPEPRTPLEWLLRKWFSD